MIAGQPYTVSWSSTNAWLVSWTCSASGSGFSGSGELAPSGTVSGIADPAWVGFDSNCQWTAEGDEAIKVVNETLRTVPLVKGQTIYFNTPADTVYGGSAVALYATATSYLPISFTSNTPATCSVSGSSANPVGAGYCSVTANQYGNASYSPAPAETRGFTVYKGSQYIGFAALPPKRLGDAPFSISAPTSSGLTVTFASLTPAVCTVSGSTVSLAAAGTCSIAADQAGNSNYNAAPRVTQSFDVQPPLPSAQTIGFAALPGKVFGDAPFGVSAYASSGLAVSFTSATPPVCTVSGSTVSLAAAGTCSITASQAGNASYYPAPAETRSFPVYKAGQSIAFAALPSKILGTAPFSVSASASSGLAVTFASLTPSVCTVSGLTVALVGGGICSIAADQGGNGNYNAAPQVTQSFSVPPLPGIEVRRVPATLIAGQTYTVTWSTTNATSLSYACSANGTGFSGTAGVDVNGSSSGTADVAWIGYPSSCTWTATGPGGSKTYAETLTTIPDTTSVPTVSLSATPTNVRVDSGQSASIAFTGNGNEVNGQLVKLELFQDAGNGYGGSPVRSSTGASSSLALNTTLPLAAGSYRFKLRATDSQGKVADSAPVLVTVTDSALLGAVSGVRINAAGVPELVGWTCQDGSSQGLLYSVYRDAPPALGGLLLASGTANLSSEADNASVQSQCHTPGAGHHFVLDLSAYTTSHAGTPLFVQAQAAGGSTVLLPCGANNCTMPGSLRIGLTTPANGDRYTAPANVFMRALLTNGSGSYDEIAFNINGEWINAQPDTAAGSYYASKSGLAASPTPYPVYAKVRQGSSTIYSVQNLIYVDANVPTIALTAPANNAAVGLSTPLSLSATVSTPAASSAVVASVKFYANDGLIALGSNSNGIWTAQWTPTQPGNLAITAKAFDGGGNQLAISGASSINVSAPQGPSSATPIPVDITPPHLGNGPAGSLPGQLQVSAGGAATYSIPLAVPPGTAGMVPALSLQYNSDESTGSAGLGWSVGGFPSLQRCGRTVASEGRADTIRLVDDDRLCLDGQHLILVKGDPNSNAAYWADGAEYRTELETFSRISAQVAPNGKRSFKVETKDGQILYFGDSTDSLLEGVRAGDNLSIPYRWRLSRRADRSGNYISYSYSKDAATGESKPLDVRWGGNSNNGQSHYARLHLNYLPRPDARTVYVAGNRADERLRLDSIVTATDTNADGSGGTTAQTTKLSYEISPSSGRSLLSSVQQCDGSGVCLPATRFEWGKPDPAAEKKFLPLGGERVGPNLYALWGDRTAVTVDSPKFIDSILTGDFNGDGKIDILERHRMAVNNYQQRLYLSNADGADWTISTPFAAIGGNLSVMEMGDFDGDGQIDLLVADTPFANGNWRICRSRENAGQGYVCDTPVSFPSAAFNAFSPPNPARLVRDVDADGKDDIFFDAGYDDGTVNTRKYICYSRNAGFDCAQTTIPLIDRGVDTETRNVVSHSSADIDGDGRVDNVVLNRCFWEKEELVLQHPMKWNCGSGAGIEITNSALLFTNQWISGGWFTLSGEGNHSGTGTATLPVQGSGVVSSDFNADGYSDVVFGSAQMNTNVTPASFAGNICYSKGNGYGDCRVLPASNLVNGLNLDHLMLTVGDFDGDGVVDVLRPGHDTWEVDNINAYQLCKIGADAGYHRCESWQGPLFKIMSTRHALTSGGYPDATSNFLGDFNGDGKTDIVNYLGRDYNGGDKWQIYTAADQAKPNEAIDKLIRSTNGYGLPEKVDYAVVNDTAVYHAQAYAQDGGEIVAAYPVKRAYPNRQLVKTLHRGNGQGGWLGTAYQYYAYANDAGGRGNLGFARQDSKDLQNSVVTSTWYSQTFPYNGMVVASQSQTPGGVLLQSGSYWPEQQLLPQANGKSTVFAFVKSSSVARRDWDGQDLGRTVSSYAYGDGWGNLTQSDSSSTLAGGPEFTSRIVNSYDNAAAGWRLGELRSSSETRSVPGSSIARQIDYTYDANGLRASETRQGNDPALRLTTRYERNPFGLVTNTTQDWFDPAGNAPVSRVVSQVAYDSQGRFPRSVTNALNQSIVQSFDPRTGAPASLTRLDGLTVSWDHDGFGRQSGETRPDGNQSLSLERQCDSACPAGAASVLIEDQRHNGVRSAVPRLHYRDSAGRLLQTLTWGFDGKKILSEQRHDPLGRLWERDWPRYEGEPAVLATRYDYDQLNRVAFSYAPDEAGKLQTTETRYQGSSVVYLNAKGQSKTDQRDAWGRLEKSTDADNGLTLYQHDAWNNLSQTTDPKGNQIRVGYDALGRKTDLRDPDLGWIHYELDPLGQVWQQTSPKQRAQGQSTRLRYDALGRLLERLEPDLTSRWVYDQPAAAGVAQSACIASRSCGRLIEARTSNGIIQDYYRSHSYDALGRPDSTVISLDALYTAQTEYDAWSRPIRSKHQRGNGQLKAVDQRYNGYGYLARLERNGQLLWQADAQDASQRLRRAALGNGLTVSRTYNDHTGRLTQGAVQNPQNQAQLQEGYDYDALGNVMQRSQYWPAAGFTENFDYDNLNRLTSSKLLGQPQNDQSYTYDAIGNLKSKSGNGDYSYPEGAGAIRPHAVQNIASLGSFAYDANGNLENGAGRTTTWTSFDMPKSIAKGGNSSDFAYGPEHQRSRQSKSDGTTVWYAGAQEAEIKGGQLTLKTYWPHGLGVEIDKPGASASELNWTHLDRLGSPVAISDANGNLKEKLAYDAWGKRRSLDGGSSADSIDGQTDNKGYTGHEMLDQLDLVHMNGRVYDPQVARFMSADPVIQDPEHSQSYNRYTYVWNNPTNLTDPSGFVTSSGSATGSSLLDGIVDSIKELFTSSKESSNQGSNRTSEQSNNNNSSDNSSNKGSASRPAAQVTITGSLAAARFAQWELNQTISSLRSGAQSVVHRGGAISKAIAKQYGARAIPGVGVLASIIFPESLGDGTLTGNDKANSALLNVDAGAGNNASDALSSGTNSAPPVPGDLVGDQSDPRAGTSNSGKRHTSGPLTPENGGTGDAEKDFDKLTGGTGRPFPGSDGRSKIPGAQVGDNGVWIRPGTKNPGDGSRIEIPGNGNKLPETLHY